MPVTARNVSILDCLSSISILRARVRFWIGAAGWSDGLAVCPRALAAGVPLPAVAAPQPLATTAITSSATRAGSSRGPLRARSPAGAVARAVLLPRTDAGRAQAGKSLQCYTLSQCLLAKESFLSLRVSSLTCPWGS